MGSGVVGVSSTSETLVTQIREKIEEIGGDVASIVGKGEFLATEADWTGGDRTLWMGHWESEVSPTLTQIHTDLETIADDVDAQVQALKTAGGGWS